MRKVKHRKKMAELGSNHQAQPSVGPESALITNVLPPLPGSLPVGLKEKGCLLWWPVLQRRTEDETSYRVLSFRWSCWVWTYMEWNLETSSCTSVGAGMERLGVAPCTPKVKSTLKSSKEEWPRGLKWEGKSVGPIFYTIILLGCWPIQRWHHSLFQQSLFGGNFSLI